MSGVADHDLYFGGDKMDQPGYYRRYQQLRDSLTSKQREHFDVHYHASLKNPLFAYGLSFFFNNLGVDRFYAGYIGYGFFKLGLSFLTFFIFLIWVFGIAISAQGSEPSVAVMMLGVIPALLYLTGYIIMFVDLFIIGSAARRKNLERMEQTAKAIGDSDPENLQEIPSHMHRMGGSEGRHLRALNQIRDTLDSLEQKKHFDQHYLTRRRNPVIYWGLNVWYLGLFGVDRFALGQIGAGFAKLAAFLLIVTVGVTEEMRVSEETEALLSLLIFPGLAWWISDFFRIGYVTRKKNLGIAHDIASSLQSEHS